MTLITGAAGHVGANLIRVLLKRGRRVRAAVHEDFRAFAGLDIEKTACDITDRTSVERALEGVDVVYHCAARIAISKRDERGMAETNVEGTRNLADAALLRGVRRFVHFSSIHAISSGSPDETVDETRPPVDRASGMLYDATKAEGERIVLDAVQRGLDAVIVNPTAVIGPYDFKPSLMGDFFLMLLRGRLPGLVRGGFNWVDARDVAAGAVLAEEKGRRGERYILGGTWESVQGLSRLIEAVAGVKTTKYTIPLLFAYIGLPVLALGSAITGSRRLYTRDSLKTLAEYRSVSSRKAETELGYRHRSLEETIKDTVAWFEASGSVGAAGKA
ncbi:MAG: NAD-dependent epimerase/dehydratase family protein [Spirochaetales bacterium]|nr:NAD-dependent epimerase/dehydratase family protein [Spirochaetales bacterium]